MLHEDARAQPAYLTKVKSPLLWIGCYPNLEGAPTTWIHSTHGAERQLSVTATRGGRRRAGNKLSQFHGKKIPDFRTETDDNRAVFANITDGGTGVVTVDATFTGLTATIAEAGIFTDVSAGEMFNRVVFTGVALTSGDSFKATCALTFSAA